MGWSFLAVMDDSTRWVVYGLGAVMLIYFVVRPLLRRKDPLERPAFASLSRQKSVEQQMQNVLVELSDMARQVTAQLDTRSHKLELLIDEADRRIAELQRLNQTSDCAAPPPPRSIAPEAEKFDDPRHADVYSLSDAGRSIPEICRQLGRPTGEVELILALRKRAS